MNNTIEYGSSLTGTANDIAFALETMQKAGFMIRQPVSVDLRDVACQMLGIDSDYDVERLVSELVTAIDQASVSLQAIESINASVCAKCGGKVANGANGDDFSLA